MTENIIDADRAKRMKAKKLRYKKPIVKELNLMTIEMELSDIQEACEDVRWYFDSDDDSLLNALDGDQDEEYEFKMMFGDLCAECDQLIIDLHEEWVPKCFDHFFVSIEAGEDFGGLLGYDSYEQDYFGLSCSDVWAEDESKKVLKRLTKDELIASARQCFRVYQSFIALRYRYDCLKAAMDILRDENTAYLQMVKEIEKLYERAEKEKFDEYGDATKKLDSFFECLLQEAWIY